MLPDRRALSDTRGASLVEYLVILGAVALLALAAFKKFGASIDEKVDRQAITVELLQGDATTKPYGAKNAPPGQKGVFPTFGTPPFVAHEKYGVGSGTGEGSAALTAADGSAPAAPDAKAAPPKESGAASDEAKPTDAKPDEAKKAAQGEDKGDYVVSEAGQKQMDALLAYAKAQAGGKKPGGWCYRAVMKYINAVGYGKIPKGGLHGTNKPAIPWSHWAYAHMFADYLNIKDASGVYNYEKLGLQKLHLKNPYDAPPGAIVVVRAGTPGTSHPTAGDIAVAAGNGVFYNDGKMGYKGPQHFTDKSTYVLGIYIPK